MRRVAAVVAIAVLWVLAGVPAAAQERVPDGPLLLVLDDVVPRVVTSDGPGTLTVTGTLTNTGDQPVEDLVVRVQRGNPLTTEGRLRDALDGVATTDAVTPQFLPLTASLAPRQQVPVRLTVPLRGAAQTTLALAATGVHELLVNVNGAPVDGDRARLAAVRMLLPVLSLPPAADGGRASPPVPGPATPFTLLYPITDIPRRLPSVATTEDTLLTDDELAASFAPGGRLGGLVAALAEEAPVGSPVRDATCLAVDPDLLETAEAMRGGYSVRGADGVLVPGAGGAVAGQWLDRLRTVASGGCVVALPYADADLVALTRGGLGAAAAAAIVDGRQVAAQLLQTPVVPGVTWPADGVLDEPTLDVVAGAQGRALVLDADGIGQSRTGAGVVPVAGGSAPQVAVLADPLLTLAATGSDVSAEPEPGGAVVADSPTGSGTPLATQDAIGTLVFRAGPAPNSTGGAPLVLAPPHRWAVEGTGARALLDAVGQLVGVGRLTPRSLDEVVSGGSTAGTATRSLGYPLTAGGREIPASVVGTIRAAADDLADLRSAVVEDSGVGVAPDEVFVPLTRGIIRPASAALRSRPDAATGAATATLARVAEVRGTIRVLEPPSGYSLGTSDAPLPLTVANGLPLTVTVRIEVSSTSGLRVAPIPEVRIPPQGRRQVSANAQVTRSGRFAVDAAVRTPDGGLLGPPSRLQVRSTAYGTITVWLTAGGGVLLVLLVARRIVRRIRGLPDRPARGRGPSGPPPVVPVGPPSPAHPTPRVPATGDLADQGRAERDPAGDDPTTVPDDLGPTDRFPLTRPGAYRYPPPAGPPPAGPPPYPPGPPRVPSPRR